MKRARLAVFLLLSTFAFAQSQIVDATVHSPGLEHNLLGDSADQPISIYLPAAYSAEPQRRFATIYFLHGYSDTASPRVARILQPYLDKLIAAHAIEPMIVVAPNGLNKYFGSFYTNSAVTGNWDDYIARDVVGYVDAHYRTLAAPGSRGIAGHSMGGYGALMLAFRHPDVFGSVYGMSPCCTTLEGDLSPSNQVWKHIAQVKSPDELGTILQHEFLLAAVIAMDAAFAPDPQNRPLLGDPAFVVRGDQLVPNPEAQAAFASHVLSTAVPALLPSIARLHAIYIDYGAEDEFSHIPLGARQVSAELARAGIPNTLEVYEGTHGDRVRQRVEQRLLPWMSQQLKH